MPYGITQCYLSPDRGDIPAFTPAEAGTRLSDPGGMQGWVDLVGGWPVTYRDGILLLRRRCMTSRTSQLRSLQNGPR